MDIIARYRLNGDDTLECMHIHDPSIRTNFVLGTSSSLLLITIGLAWIKWADGKAFAWIAVGFGLSTLLIIIQRRSQTRKRLRHSRSQAGPTELIVRQSGLTVSEQDSRTELAWSRFINLRESENHFLLYRSVDTYSIVPKRGFANEEEVNAFREISRTLISPA